MVEIDTGVINGLILLKLQCIICDKVLYQDQDSHRSCKTQQTASADINVTSMQIRQTVYKALGIPVPVPTDPNGPSFFKEFKEGLPLCCDCCFNVGCLSNIRKQIDYSEKQWDELTFTPEEFFKKATDGRSEAMADKENDCNMDRLDILLDPSKLTESLRNSEVQILRQIVYHRRHRHPLWTSLTVDGKKSDSPMEQQNQNHSQQQDIASEGLGETAATTAAATSPMDTALSSSPESSLPRSNQVVAQNVPPARTLLLNELEMDKNSKTIQKNYSPEPTSILKNREQFSQKIRPTTDPEPKPKDPSAAKNLFSLDHNYSYVDPYNVTSSFMPASKNVSYNVLASTDADPNNKDDKSMATYWMFPEHYHSVNSDSCNDPEYTNEDNGSDENEDEIMELQICCNMGHFTGTEMFDNLVLDLSDNSQEQQLENGIEVECVENFPLPEPSANVQVEVCNESQQDHSKDVDEIYVQNNYRVNGEVTVSSNSMATDQCGENHQVEFVTSSSSESKDAEIRKYPEIIYQWNSDGKLQCQYCNKAYSRLDYYKNHVKMHTGEALECVICKKILSKPRALAEHLKSHSDKKDSFSCGFCSESFETTRQLSSHAKLHEKPLHCQYCGRGYKSAIWLRVHVDRFHSGQK